MPEKTTSSTIFLLTLRKMQAMGHDAIKLELIQWLSRLEDNDTLNYLKIVKDSSETKSDWWHDLSDLQKAAIERGLKDVEAGRVFSHNEIKQKYGL